MANLDPAVTFNVDDFISMKISDQLTYYNFSILEKNKGVEHLDFNLIDSYIDLLNTEKITFTDEQFRKYKYHPDILAYDVYGSVQLDFIILALNDMCDPKEFNRKTIYLPYASELKTFLDDVYSANSTLINQNRSSQNITL